MQRQHDDDDDLPCFLKTYHEFLYRTMIDDQSLTPADLYHEFIENFPRYDLTFDDARAIDNHLFGARKARYWRKAYDFPDTEGQQVSIEGFVVGFARNIGVFTFDLGE